MRRISPLTAWALLSVAAVSEGFVVVPSQKRTATNPSSQLHFFQFPNVLESLLTGSKQQPGGSSSSSSSQQRDTLKTELLETCRSFSSDPKKVVVSNQKQRAILEPMIEELTSISPTRAAATSPLLQRKWALEWTTEKEINFFLDVGFSQNIFQTIAYDDKTMNVSGGTIDNSIPFVKGGGFFVTGTLEIPDPQGMRTNFEFATAKLDISPWKLGTYEFPPVGAGWFDTLYLDESLRIDINSRDDILICTPASVP